MGVIFRVAHAPHAGAITAANAPAGTAASITTQDMLLWVVGMGLSGLDGF